MTKKTKEKKLNKKMMGKAIFLIAGTIAATRLISIGQQWESSRQVPQKTPEWVKEELASSAAQREAEKEQEAKNEKILSGAEEYQKEYEEEKADELNSYLEELREDYDEYLASPSTATSFTTPATSTIQVEAAEVTGFPEYSDETYLLAQIVYCEAGGQGSSEMSYVGSVVINRARTDYHDFQSVDTIREVLYQGYGTSAQQYAEETIDKIEDGIEPSDDAMEVASGLIDGTIDCLDEEILFQMEDWMPTWDGIEEVYIPGATELYARPTDF